MFWFSTINYYTNGSNNWNCQHYYFNEYHSIINFFNKALVVGNYQGMSSLISSRSHQILILTSPWLTSFCTHFTTNTERIQNENNVRECWEIDPRIQAFTYFIPNPLPSQCIFRKYKLNINTLPILLHPSFTYKSFSALTFDYTRLLLFQCSLRKMRATSNITNNENTALRKQVVSPTYSQ